MGVQGLTTFVEGNRNLLPNVKFRDSRLVIDGCSLYFRLYFNSGLDQVHGGDYDAFTSLLTQFFSALAACNIQPYVVLDGGMDPSDKKFATLRQRLQSKIKEADSLCHGRHGSVLPILTRDVFIQVLRQLGVPLVQCPAEADWEIACLAHQWKCPVLSNDSDFYIFDLPGGYLPLNFFHWTNLNGKASQRYISARCYTASGLCRWFGSMNQELLPLFAVLNGNDYSPPKDVETFLAKIDVSVKGGGGGRGRGGAPSRIEMILLWLSVFSGPAEVLEEVSMFMGEAEGRGGGGRNRRGQMSGLSSQLWAGMQEYNISAQSSLAHWFSRGEVVLRGPTSRLAKLPECLQHAAAQGMLNPLVMDALMMHRVLLIPQVENSKLASSHCCARAIRQAIYGILLQPGQDHVIQGRGEDGQLTMGRGGPAQPQGMRGGRGPVGRGRGGGVNVNARGWSQGQILPPQQWENIGYNRAQAALPGQAQGCSAPVCVEEYDRLDLNLKKNQVEALQLRNPLHLDAIGQAPPAVRLAALLEVVGVTESVLAPVPLHLRLAVAVTGFWLREAQPKPSQLQLHALVLSLVYGELSQNLQPDPTHQRQPSGQQLHWEAERNVWAGMDRQHVRPGERRGLDVGDAHSLSQWQACLWTALCLNQLLLLPLPEPHLSGVFSGTLVHGLLRYLKGGRSAESLLAGGSWSTQLYSSLLNAVMKCSFKGHPSSSASRRGRRGGGRGRRGRGGRGRGRGGRGAGRGRGSVEEMNNRFALLMSDEEFDDD
ncbi:protein asteroid homolog 1 [Sphaeramia orbicularis]|uniref:XPG N-terminal domain-containing protein n=1 Tax=Sphaeramia orbicularis TaxID=375764 RepID=A0A672YEV2_9TELE|nr:protein asteroid homolog 1 [Sphaeramia orbicularis]XP_030003416.1 protein asteroid homolog 1 [Sphaeramia orbicularis]XP_030003417.1 protein asteroid homolog 1 [Sphaeramia orbicularis]